MTREQFWAQIFQLVFTSGRNVEIAASVADMSLVEFEKRFASARACATSPGALTVDRTADGRAALMLNGVIIWRIPEGAAQAVRANIDAAMAAAGV